MLYGLDLGIQLEAMSLIALYGAHYQSNFCKKRKAISTAMLPYD